MNNPADTTGLITDARAGLFALMEGLSTDGYVICGPTVRDQVIVYDELDGIDDLPAGWGDEQDGGRYRLRRRDDNAYFGHNLGPHSFKRFLHVPEQPLWRVERVDGRLSFIPVRPASPSYAFIGMRACEIRALQIQDRVLIEDKHRDPHYAARRADNFIVAVNCAQAAATCFCTAMDTGPGVTDGFDLALTELIDGDRHELLIEAGSERGRTLLDRLPGRRASAAEITSAREVTARTAAMMTRHIDRDQVHDLLLDNLEHPRWDAVADRCLSCGNCTQVCPTCFCTNTVDTSSLEDDSAARSRHWDSCFNADFSYLHGGSVRQTTRSRYRQWLTHKLATWQDQFDTSGCVGCGRCISWCPVGIDLTEEVNAIASTGDTP